MNRRLGVLGGGQLGEMLALAAHPLGLAVSVLDPNPHAPARHVAKHVHTEFDDPKGLSELSDCDFVTFEFENVPESAARQLAEQGPVFPPVKALRVSQDRWTEKSAFMQLGIPTTPFLRVDSAEDARAAFSQMGPLVLKTRRFGYDGKGQAVVQNEHELSSMYEKIASAPAIAERFVRFDRELSIIACRGGDGAVVFYPLVQNIHEEGILRTTLAPAPGVSKDLQEKARDYAKRLMDHLDYVGVLALELFEVGGELIANEFAPRVHNSGHWTIEGAFTSQFENHVRAVCGLPLGSTEPRGASVMTNFIGRVPPAERVLAVPGAHLHDYKKTPRSGRKVGHVTVLGASLGEAMSRTKLIDALIQS